MKKVLLGFTTALLTVILCLTLAGCDKSGNIKKAFENEGYTVTEMTTKDNDSIKKILAIGLTQDQIAEIDKYSVFICSEGSVVSIPVAAIVKFSSSSEMKDFLTTEDSEGKKDTSAYDSAKEKGWVNGNCYILTLSSKALNVFKNA